MLEVIITMVELIAIAILSVIIGITAVFIAYFVQFMIHEIRNKNLYDLNEQELRIRCAYDEQYIRQLEKEISRLKTIVERKERKYGDRF